MTADVTLFRWVDSGLVLTGWGWVWLMIILLFVGAKS